MMRVVERESEKRRDSLPRREQTGSSGSGTGRRPEVVRDPVVSGGRQGHSGSHAAGGQVHGMLAQTQGLAGQSHGMLAQNHNLVGQGQAEPARKPQTYAEYKAMKAARLAAQTQAAS